MRVESLLLPLERIDGGAKPEGGREGGMEGKTEGRKEKGRKESRAGGEVKGKG